MAIIEWMNLKSQLKLFIERNYLTLTTLSEKSGVPKSTISDWLHGSAPRDLRKLKKVADALETTVDQLCWGKGIAEDKEKFMKYQDEINTGVFEVILRRPRGKND